MGEKQDSMLYNPAKDEVCIKFKCPKCNQMTKILRRGIAWLSCVRVCEHCNNVVEQKTYNPWFYKREWDE